VAGGCLITISGYDLDGAAVEIDGEECVVSQSASASVGEVEITCIVPPALGGAGVVDLGLSAHGEVVTLTGGFEYIETVLSLNLNKSDVAIGGTPNVLYKDYVVANVITNNPTGYHLEIESGQPDLVCASDGAYRIVAVSGPSPTLTNAWGYYVDDDGDELTVPSVWSWAGVTNSPVNFKSFPTGTDLVNGDDTVLWIGTRFNLSIPACRYGGEVTVSAIAN
jgi:hypothetical protein